MKKQKMRVRIDFENIRIFDDKVEVDKLDVVKRKLEKKFG